MDAYTVEISIEDALQIDVALADDAIQVDATFVGDVISVSGDCPTITEIDGGIADSDSNLSSDPFQTINGTLDGGNSN